jgi:hypothetical protein
MTPEGKVKAKVNAALKVFGPWVWRFMPVQTGYGAPALDYLLCVNCIFVAVETKVKGKKLTPLQEGTRVNITGAGGLVFIVDDDRSLWILIRCLMQLVQGGPYDLVLARMWQRDADTQAQDEGTCSELVRQFIKNKAFDPAVGWDYGASGTSPT